MKRAITISSLAILVFAGCAKEGLDGSATLVVKPEHHGDPIVSSALYRDSVFIKFGVDEIPANPTQDYDAIVVGEPNQGFITVKNVKWGEYSIYCTGYDSAFSARVTGGTTVKLKRKDRESEQEVIVLMSE